MLKEYKINENITLKLENNKTNIYIKGELFLQCKFLLMNILVEEPNLYERIDSIDDAAETLDNSLQGTEGIRGNKYISEEEEFWAHCSNLQSWYEHEYNTKLLHSNLSFPLLKKLREIGDPLAKERFKEEIANRFFSGSSKIQDFLLEEGYLDLLSKVELLSLIKDSDIITELENSIGAPMRINTRYYPHPYGFVVENGVVTYLSLDNRGLKTVPDIIRELSSLEGLILTRNSLVSLPDWTVEFSQLEYLDVSNNKLEKIPDSIGSLHKLKCLKLNNNKLRRLPNSIGNLLHLKYFSAIENNMIHLPETIGKLIMLEELIIPTNLLETLPESIENLSSLKTLHISENPIKKLPSSINNLENLKALFLKGIDKNAWNLTYYMEKRIKIYN